MEKSRESRASSVTRAVALAALTAAALLVWAAPAEATFPGGNGKIAFWAPLDTYMVNPDGTGLSLVPVGCTFSNASWSPDGEKLAYIRPVDTCDRTYTQEALEIARPDGSDRLKLAETHVGGGLSWSPDGKQIAFSSFGERGSGAIYLISADGSGLRKIFDLPAEDPVPTVDWSPDGTKIALDLQGKGNVYLMKSDGSGLTQLTDASGPNGSGDYSDFSPSWSPDGRRIAFTANPRERTNFSQIGVINADGSGRTTLSTPVPAMYPVWSPDGTKIAFASVSCGDTLGKDCNGLYTMNVDGSGLKLITPPPGDIENLFAPDWQPLVIDRGDFKNSAQYCKEERVRLGRDAFGRKYGTNDRGASAFGQCVKSSR